GTDLGKIKQKMEETWTPEGLAVLVDVGGAETNSEMAIGLLDSSMSSSVIICDAPIVEGAIMAAAEAASGSPLAVVVKTAEESFS
ncbi:MAG: PTS mannose transporter subunit IID, partial [Deltaproteobacteria bacterium]|nr:PTS mannose transporter subunit IID [Deltaproteobacteria bacterium]